MYKKPFYITDPVWNNAFSHDLRKNKKLYVPELKIIDSLDDIELQDDKEKIAFEDFWFDDKLSINYGLKNFYEFPPLSLPLAGEKNKKIKAPIYLFDNHNHAFYFWYLARKNGIIWDNNTLIHIDEHADMRDNNKCISDDDSKDLEKVFNFTNEVLNVGDYIIPAQKEWLIWEVIQIRNETNLSDYICRRCEPYVYPTTNIILNLDLDFFQPDLDYIDFKQKKEVILDAAKKADVITVATSPFFIDQNLALKVFRELFW